MSIGPLVGLCFWIQMGFALVSLPTIQIWFAMYLALFTSHFFFVISIIRHKHIITANDKAKRAHKRDWERNREAFCHNAIVQAGDGWVHLNNIHLLYMKTELVGTFFAFNLSCMNVVSDCRLNFKHRPNNYIGIIYIMRQRQRLPPQTPKETA